MTTNLRAQLPPPTTQRAQTWQTPGAKPGFSILLSPGVAPCVLHVNGLRFPLTVGSPLTARYDWNFDDPHGTYNTLTGFNAAHIYDRPGQYAITLSVTDETGKKQSATANVTITENRRRRIFVSPEGSDRNIGVEESAPLRSLAAAVGVLPANSEILLQAGMIHSVTTVLKLKSSDVVISRYGHGADPIVMLDKDPVRKSKGFISIDPHADGVLIEHLTFDTPFAVGDNDPAPKIGIEAIVARGGNISVRDCTFLNIDSAIDANGSPAGLLMQGCKSPLITGLRAYLIWGQGSELVCLGNFAANSTREHIVRMSGVKGALIFGNDFANLDRQSVDKDDYSKGSIEMHNGSYAYIAGNKVAAGPIRVGPRGGEHEDASTASDWAVIENNRLTDTGIVAYPGSHHIMIRNNIIRNDKYQAIQLQAPDNAGRINGDIHILNNTGIDRGTSGTFIKLWGHVNGIEMKNNLYVAPDLKVGIGGTSAFNTAEKDLSSFTEISHNLWPAFTASGSDDEYMVANQKHTKSEWTHLPQVKDDAFADITVDDTAAPIGDTAALQHGQPTPEVWSDINGKPRPTDHTTIGAVEIDPPTTINPRQKK